MRGCVRRGLSSARSLQAQTKFADADREGAVVDFEEHDGAQPLVPPYSHHTTTIQSTI